jgi:hypothetical protein
MGCKFLDKRNAALENLYSNLLKILDIIIILEALNCYGNGVCSLSHFQATEPASPPYSV